MKKCNRCGEYFNEEDSRNIANGISLVNINSEDMLDEEIDTYCLCPNCINEFENWMANIYMQPSNY